MRGVEQSLEGGHRWSQLVLIALVAVLVMSLWFSASAVVPRLHDSWHLSSADATWLTTSVQIGFVVGAVGSALFNLADLLSTRRLIAISALAGAAANAAVAAWATGLTSAVPLRFLTGVALAGVYPPALKLMASWFSSDRGLALGTVVGALALGSGSPHLIGAWTGLSWREVLVVASAAAVIGALLVWLAVRDGPLMAASPPFHPGYVARMFRDPPQRLVSFGYFGHMWELYAVWTWLPSYVAASFVAAGDPGHHSAVELASFAAIGIAGLAGSLWAGLAADRGSRASVTIVAMGVSGGCCLLSAVVYGLSPVLVVGMLLVWGMAVLADSAQFSTALTEVADRSYVGTALTAQTAIGFLITVISIRLLPTVEAQVGWRWAFVPLALGPALGIVAMVRARRVIG